MTLSKLKAILNSFHLFPYPSLKVTSFAKFFLGLPFRPTGLPTMLKTLPELLKTSGYSTHLIGKWHLGYCHDDYTPTKRGFDTFFGIYSQQSDHYTREHVINRFIGPGYDLRRNNKTSYDGSGEYSTHLWEQETISLIQSLNSSKPWFIELAPTAAHTPFQAPDKYTEMYSKQRKKKFRDEYVAEADLKATRLG